MSDARLPRLDRVEERLRARRQEGDAVRRFTIKPSYIGNRGTGMGMGNLARRPGFVTSRARST